MGARPPLLGGFGIRVKSLHFIMNRESEEGYGERVGERGGRKGVRILVRSLAEYFGLHRSLYSSRIAFVM